MEEGECPMTPKEERLEGDARQARRVRPWKLAGKHPQKGNL